MGSGTPRGASPAINSCRAGVGRWCRGLASAWPTPSPGLGRDPAPPQSGREGAEGLGAEARGARRSCRVGCLRALSCLSFLPLPGGGGDGRPGSSGDPVCDISFGRRGWKRAGTGRRQIVGFPSACWGLITCGWRGESLSLRSPAWTAPGGRAKAPLAASVQPCGQRGGSDGFAEEAAGLPAPRRVQPRPPLARP